MDEHKTSQESLSAGGLDDIAPFLPYLLQDLWSLGGCPETAIAMMQQAGVAPAPDDRVVDLGCGKGAMLIELAKRFGCRGYGVDLMAAFIDDARRRAGEHGVAARVEFTTGDMRDSARAGSQHGWIVYGHDASIFGGLSETLQALRSALRPGGYLVLDAVCRAPEAIGGDPQELPSLSELRAWFTQSAFIEVARLTMPVGDVRAANEANTAAIAARAGELKRKHPDRARLFDDYVRIQLEECMFLENECESSYFLLRAH